MGNCHKNEFAQHSILDSTLFLLHINDLPDNYNCNITIYADNTTLYSKWEQTSDLWQQLKLASTYKTLGQEVDFWFQCLKTQLVLFEQPNITAAIMLKWLGLFFSKNHLLRSQRFSSKFNLGSHIISVAKTVSKKTGALICSMMFLSPKVALHLFKSIIWPCMKYFCHIWAGVYNCWSFTCCLSWTLDSSTKCSQLKSFV